MNSNVAGRAFWTAVALSWMGLIFYLSSQSSTGVAALEQGTGQSLALRKLGHAVAFGALAIFLRWGFGQWRSGLSVYLIAFLIAAAYGVGDEVHQGFTPGRFRSGTDMLIDAAGAVLALGLWRSFEAWNPFAAPDKDITGDRPGDSLS